MTPVRISFRYEFTPVPSGGFVFVYMIPAQNLVPKRVIPVRVHPGNRTGARFSFRYENSFRCHVNAARPFAAAWNHSPGSLERIAHEQSSIFNSIWRQNHVGRQKASLHVNTVWNHNVIPVSNSHRCEFSHVNIPFRRKRQLDAEHETGSPSGVDMWHALLTAISTRGCALKFAAYFQPVNNGESAWIVAGIFDFGLRTDVRLSTIRFLVLEFLCCRGSYRKSDWLYLEPLSLSASWSFLASSNDFSTIFGPGLFLTVNQGDFSSFAFFITTFYAMLESEMECCFTVKFYIQRRDMRWTRCRQKYSKFAVNSKFCRVIYQHSPA